MSTRLETEQRELAVFIRAGSRRSNPCVGSYFDEHGGSWPRVHLNDDPGSPGSRSRHG